MAIDDDFDFSPRPVVPVGPTAIPSDLEKVIIEPFTLVVFDTVINGVREYLATDQRDELGGCLHGQRFETDGRTVVEITDFTPLPSDDRGSAHFVFGSKAKERMLRSSRGRSDQLIGWFHSHPRMGDPFMSSDDRDVQEREYNKPWLVSMVTAVGEWGMPIGFWRLENGKLVRISSYYVRMTSGDKVGASDRRYLRASFGMGVPAVATVARARQVLVGLRGGPSATIVRFIEQELNASYKMDAIVDGVSLLQVALSLGERLSHGVFEREQVVQLMARLEGFHFLRDRTQTVFRSDHVGNRLVMMGDRFVTFQADSGKFALALLAENAILPLDLTLIILACAAGPSQNHVWMLLDGGVLFSWRMNNLNDIQFDHRMAKVADLTQPADITAREKLVLVKSGARLVRFSTKVVGSHPAVDEAGVTEVVLKNDKWLLVHHFLDSEIALLRWAPDFIELLDIEGRTVVRGAPVGAMGDRRIISAVATPAGIWLLLDCGDEQRLVMLPQDLSKVDREIHVNDDLGAVTSISVDANHRVFVSVGASVRLVSETGAPGRDWCYSATLISEMLRGD